MRILKKIKEKLAKWLMKDMPLPIQPIIVENQNLKKFHAQHIVPYYEWNTVDRWVDPDCFVKQFKYKLVDELLNEIIIKAEETPDGVMYSADLLLQNI